LRGPDMMVIPAVEINEDGDYGTAEMLRAKREH
jgi:hypothetical protein